MITYEEEVTQKLNNLLEHTYDAECGYALSQAKLADPAIKRFLDNKVQQRNNFAHQLRMEILEYGYLRDNGGRIKGDIHSTFMKLTLMLTENHSALILAEVERFENESLRMYNRLLQSESLFFPESTRNLLFKHRNLIRAALNISIDAEQMMV